MASRYPFSSLGFGSDADPFALLHDEMDRLFDQALHRLGVAPPVRAGSALAMTGPRMDVTETDRQLCIEMDVPGVARQDLELSLDGEKLTIRGHRKPLERGQDRQPTVHLSERAHGMFERTVQLPFAAEMDQCNAALRDGVLTVTLEKVDAGHKARRIEIRGPEQAAPEQRTQLAHGQTELLDAEKPAPSTAKKAARSAAQRRVQTEKDEGGGPQAEHGAMSAQTAQQGDQRVHH